MLYKVHGLESKLLKIKGVEQSLYGSIGGVSREILGVLAIVHAWKTDLNQMINSELRDPTSDRIDTYRFLIWESRRSTCTHPPNDNKQDFGSPNPNS